MYAPVIVLDHHSIYHRTDGAYLLLRINRDANDIALCLSLIFVQFVWRGLLRDISEGLLGLAEKRGKQDENYHNFFHSKSFFKMKLSKSSA